MTLLKSLFIFSSLFLLPLHAHSAIVYQYIGNNYESITDSARPSGTFTTDMRITGNFEVASTIMATTLTDVSASLLSYSFSDGRLTLTNNNSFIDSFNVQANAIGDISYWDINVRTEFTEPRAVGDQRFSITTESSPSFSIDFSLQIECIFLPCGGIQFDSAGVSGNPGNWTQVSAIPLPPAIWLFGSSLIGLFAWSRKRVSK